MKLRFQATPLRFVLLAIAILHVIGISWGMPASDSWENDSVAPRDFLPGLAATFTPGDFYTYPPFHLLVLTVLTAPITIVAIFKASAATVPAVLQEIIAPSYMTGFTLVARTVTIAMSVGLCLALAKVTAEITERKHAPELVAASAGLSMPFTYYSHTANLDVPCIFWASLSALFLVRAIARDEPRLLRRAFVFTALSIATKDQGYAMFLLGIPLSLLYFRKHADKKALLKEIVIAGVIALGLLLLLDGAITNLSGFRRRLAFLSGPASQDFATYSKDASGRLQVFLDLGKELARHYPSALVIGALYLFGLFNARKRAAALVPFAFALSFSLCFNFVARRVEERFTLPQVLFLAVYAGIALAELWAAHVALRVAAIGLCLRALWDCVELDANLVLEPRYQTEAFLRANARSTDTIEVYGLNVYLPRLPTGIHAMRIGPSPPKKRGPVPGLEEVQAPLGAINEREPRFAVVSECYSWRFKVGRSKGNDAGRVLPKAIIREGQDDDAAVFFHELFAEQLGYRLVHEARFQSGIFRRVELHASVGCPTYTFERR